MYCWGKTINGELGLGGIEEKNIYTPREVTFTKATEVEQSNNFYKLPDCVSRLILCIYNLKLFLAVACGGNFTILLTQDGKIYSCGNNDFGQLGRVTGIKMKLGIN